MNWKSPLKDILIPVLVACIPFAPEIYAKLTEPTLHYVYEVSIKRNPVNEWNRQLSLAFKQINSSGQKFPDQVPAPLLEQIGKEIYKSLPAMLSGIGFHATESAEVHVVNISGKELRNIRVHFIGCSGYDTYETYPDAYASPSNPKKSDESLQNSTVTVRYDKLFPSGANSWTAAYITFYGEDTSNCQPTVEAELPNGEVAIGKKESIDTFTREYRWDQYNHQQRVDVFFKFFLAAAVIYMFFQVRNIKKRLDRNG
jgi:hypothetical protein